MIRIEQDEYGMYIGEPDEADARLDRSAESEIRSLMESDPGEALSLDEWETQEEAWECSEVFE
jgi:hypothetical protein